MCEAEKIIHAQKNKEARNDLIEEYSDRIRRHASKAAGRFIDKHDDVWSEALIAFDEAVLAYDPDKGPFEAFAATVIRNRVTDHLRRENRHSRNVPFSAVSSEDEDGNLSEPEFEDKSSDMSDAALEILSLKEELAGFDISFFDLPAVSPKSSKTRAACMSVIRLLAEDKELSKEVRKSRQLPASRIVEELQVSTKLLERHRKYIIAGMLIIGGDYTIMGVYFNKGKEVQQR